jgi:hypothetical protein
MAKVVGAFEVDMLLRQPRMLLEVSAQAVDVAGVNEVDGAAEQRVSDALVMRQVEAVGERGIFDALLHPRPTGEAVPARHSELGVAEFEWGLEDLGIGRLGEVGMELADEMRGLRRVRGVRFP